MKRLLFLIICVLVCLLVLFSCDLFNPDDDEEDKEYFPVFEVEAASNYELGFKIGERFHDEILEFMEREADLHELLSQIVSLDSTFYFYNMLDQAEDLFPEYIEELQGTADAIGVEFEELFIWNCFGDIIALYSGSQYFNGNHINGNLVGCSTVSYNYDGNQFLGHNEDCFVSLQDLMAVVKVKLSGTPEFINFYYPALLLGVAPSMTDTGLAVSNNFIQLVGGNTNGVPHFFLLRALLEANTIQEAVETCENTPTCDGFHVTIASDSDDIVYSIEKAFDTISVIEVDGLYAHTNHFIHDDMLNFSVTTDESTINRINILQDDIAAYQDQLQDVTCDVLHDCLCDVVAIPDTSGGATTGMTVGTSIINLETGEWELYFNDPNDNKSQTLKF